MSRKVKTTHELHKKLEALIQFCRENEIDLHHNGTELTVESLIKYPELGNEMVFAIRKDSDTFHEHSGTPGSSLNSGFDDELRLYIIE